MVCSLALFCDILYVQAPVRAEHTEWSVSMKKKFDPEKIALAIVASSSYQLSISEKIELYMDAYDEAIATLKDLQPEEDS